MKKICSNCNLEYNKEVGKKGRCNPCYNIYQKNWRLKNPEKFYISQIRYRKKNQAKTTAKQKEWRKNNPEKSKNVLIKSRPWHNSRSI